MGHDVFFTNESGCQSHVRADRTDEMIDLLMLNIYCQSVRPVIQRTETAKNTKNGCESGQTSQSQSTRNGCSRVQVGLRQLSIPSIYRYLFILIQLWCTTALWYMFLVQATPVSLLEIQSATVIDVSWEDNCKCKSVLVHSLTSELY